MVFPLTVFLIFFTFVLKALSNLVELDLSHNKIAILGSNLNTKLGNIKKLNLAGNELDSVQGTKFWLSLCSHFVAVILPVYGTNWALMSTQSFSKCSSQNLGIIQRIVWVPEYEVETFYSGTKGFTGSLLNAFSICSKAIHCVHSLPLSRIKMASERVQWSNCVHCCIMTGYQVNTTLFWNEQVWTCPLWILSVFQYVDCDWSGHTPYWNGGNIIFIFVLINPLCLDCVCRILSNCETRYWGPNTMNTKLSEFVNVFYFGVRWTYPFPPSPLPPVHAALKSGTWTYPICDDRSTFKIGLAQPRSITDTATKSPFSCVYGSPVCPIWFSCPRKTIRFSVDCII